MKLEAANCLLITDFNPGTFKASLENDGAAPKLHCRVAPWGDVRSVLLDETVAAAGSQDTAIVWTRPEAAIPSFRDLAEYKTVSLDQILAEVDAFTAALRPFGKRVALGLVPLWVLPPQTRGLGLADLRPGGLAHALMAMNQRLLEGLAAASNLFALDTSRLLLETGPPAMEPSYWYMAKQPFAPAVFARATAEVKHALVTLRCGPRKLLVVDLDDTLWGGLVGEVGPAGLRLGGHDALGEAFTDFQIGLKGLRNRGVLLAIASKNDRDVALQAIRTHPEMVLREDDFAAMRINWADKAQNVAELAAELGLGLDAVVFIDDSPVERARVREALPEVLVPDWPAEKMKYARALQALYCFDTTGLTAEDRSRNLAYAAERGRHAARSVGASVDDWLRTLNLVVRVEPLSEPNLKRIAQLVNKTNQMNLSTRRLSESELREWSRGPGRSLWSFRGSDRFGDLGLVGVLSVETRGRSSRSSTSSSVVACSAAASSG